MKISILLLMLAFIQFAQAKKIQIIHINDLHSYYTGVGDGRGGYSRVKTKIDELKSTALNEGIQSIVLDAGDWGEGTSFFLTEDGSNSLKALGLLGVDVTIIGNHDHMMGGTVLSEQIKRANISTKILSANLVQTPQMNLADLVQQEVTLVIDGKKIHIIGLSTPEPHHQAALLPGFMAPPEFYLHSLAKKAKLEDKADLVVALTHIGLAYDKKLAKESEHVDVFVGGHSHDKLEEVVYQGNFNKKDIPIVQTGSHSLYVGSLIIDVDGVDNKVISYKLHDIIDQLTEDEVVKNFVELAKFQRNEMFDGRWDEIIGSSEIILSGYREGRAPKEATCWGQHMARIMKIASGADIGIHLANFSGMEIPAGPITLGNLVDNYPHQRFFADKGWEISTFVLKGKILKQLLRGIIALEKTMGINADGFTYNRFLWTGEIPIIGGMSFAVNMKINGESIKKDQDYSVAIPTEIEYVLRTLLSKKTQDILPKVSPTGKFFWNEMEEYVKVNSPIKCIK